MADEFPSIDSGAPHFMSTQVPPANFALPLTKLGIVRCRDLWHLWLGARVSTFTKYTNIDPSGGQQTLVTLDPRRIRIEIVATVDPTTGGGTLSLGPPQTFDSGNFQDFFIGDNGWVQIIRDYRSDGDAVTEPLDFLFSGTAVNISARETLLQPLPVDEPI